VYWLKMQEQLTNFVRGCVLCNTSKPRNWNICLYMPFQVPSIPWESISMDLFGGFPMNRRGHDHLFIMVDRFSKRCMFIPYKNTISRREVIELFFSHIWVHFGLSASIIYDWDSEFLGIIWTTLWEKMDIKLKYSTSFHPQTDGQTKVVNKTLVLL